MVYQITCLQDRFVEIISVINYNLFQSSGNKQQGLLQVGHFDKKSKFVNNHPVLLLLSERSDTFTPGQPNGRQMDKNKNL